MNFFTVEVVTWLGLIRYHVLFAIDIASRKVEIVGMVANPGGRGAGRAPVGRAARRQCRKLPVRMSRDSMPTVAL
jgi:hypothetical protein